MNHFFSFMAFTLILSPLFAQYQPEQPLHTQAPYIVIANPTVENIERILFLVQHKIFKVNPGKVKFLGIYHHDQVYDFNKSKELIEAKDLGIFDLQEVTGDITLDSVFKENGCSAAFREIFRKSKGAIFWGGTDMQTEIYGEKNQYSEVTDPARHLFEVSFAFHLLGGSRNPGFKPLLEQNPDYLVTGFCLGLQTMNVAAGGTLIQDIPAQVYGKFSAKETVEIDRNDLHRNYWQKLSDDKQLMGINLHTIQFTDHPFFSKSVKVSQKSQPRIYSSHHQSPGEIGTGFEITARSADGRIIEGLVHKRFPHVFAVQFHPEVPALYENRELWKFTPQDQPETYHRTIGRKSVSFHRKYWKYISACLKY
jgi:putative glutamine amidotransferase